MAVKVISEYYNDAPISDPDDENYFYSDRRYVKGGGRMTLCAYGSSNFATVTNGGRLEIFNPREKRLLFSYELKTTTWLWAKWVTFTSLIADNDNFFLSTSNGNILSCLKTESGYMFIRPEKEFPGFLVTEQVVTKHDKAGATSKPENLLGSNEKWFVYQDDYKRIVFLRKAHGEVSKGPIKINTISKTFGKEIEAHALSDTGILWVATKEIKHKQAVFYLYKIKPDQRTIKRYSWKEQNETDVLLAVSTEGDVALETTKGIFVFQPAKSETIRGPISADNDVWTCCFVTRNDREYFICCGQGRQCIRVLERQKEKNEVWELIYLWERSDLERKKDFELEHKLYFEHPWMNDEGTLLFECVKEAHNANEHGVWWLIPSKT